MEKKTVMKKLLLIWIISTLMGQVYINPFNFLFRFSVGVAFLTFLILWFESVPIMLATTITAICMVAFRTILDVFLGRDAYVCIVNHMPSVAFYVVLGLILSSIKIRKFKNRPILIFCVLGMADVISNIIEIIIRGELYISSIETIINRLLLIGFGRAFLTIVLYMTVRIFRRITIQEEDQIRYRELLLFIANMKAEIFFLNKNTQLIEHVMQESFCIYKTLKEYSKKQETLSGDELEALKQKALNLAKDIHEIKKDNKRVVMGVKNLLPRTKTQKTMNLESIFELISDNTKRQIEELNKEIQIAFNIQKDVKVENYYALISVLNNLVNNSIGAIKISGKISVIEEVDNKNVIFRVADDGCGILDKDLEAIFKPGFSTKFDRVSGNMSTGIGLTHVMNIVNNQFKGEISVESSKGSGSEFTVSIPLDRL